MRKWADSTPNRLLGAAENRNPIFTKKGFFEGILTETGQFKEMFKNKHRKVKVIVFFKLGRIQAVSSITLMVRLSAQPTKLLRSPEACDSHVKSH